METIYDWLLTNMGNAHVRGNETHYLTILNVQRETDQAGMATLDIMARTDNFEMLNLVVCPADKDGSSTIEPAGLKGRTFQNSHFFATDKQVIAFLLEGETPQSEVAARSSGFRVFTLEPANGSGDLTFPPSPEETPE